MDLFVTAILAGKLLKPGAYHVTADDSKVTFAIDGKAMAEAPVEWKNETTKPRFSTILVSNDQVREIHFGGKMRYVAIVG